MLGFAFALLLTSKFGGKSEILKEILAAGIFQEPNLMEATIIEFSLNFTVENTTTEVFQKC